MRNPVRRVVAVSVMVVGSVLPTLTLATPAGASATACSPGRTTYCAYVSGSGKHVSYVIGSFSSVSTVCNWTITAEFFDTNNHWYKTYTSKTKLGCWLTNNTQLNINFDAKAGKMYSTLKSNGVRITSVGFSIH